MKTWGTIPQFTFPIKNHIDLALNLDLIDMERAGKVSGSRFFYLKNEVAMLDMALMSFAIEELSKKGYTAVIPPCLMNREAYEGVTALGDFEDVLYKVENEDLVLNRHFRASHGCNVHERNPKRDKKCRLNLQA